MKDKHTKERNKQEEANKRNIERKTDTRILLTGMVRSGSTFVWQILNDINKYPVNRAYHYIINKGYTTFVTYRDFRDVLVSWAKLHNSTISAIYSRKGICFKFYLKNLQKYKENYWNHPDYHFIKYEDYFPNNNKALVELIYDSLELELSKDKCNRLCEKFSLEKAKVVSDKYDELQKDRPTSSLPNCDEDTGIHGGHITNNGKANAWKQYINDTEVMKIFSCLQNPLKEFGYQL